MKKPAPTCDHARPMFGCESCINKDKLQVLEQAIGTTLAPACPECGGATVYYEKAEASMTLIFLCKRGLAHDDEGVPDCEGEVGIKVQR